MIRLPLGGHPAARTADARTDAPHRAVALGALRELGLPAQGAHGAYARHHPVGASRLKRQAASLRAVQPVRLPGRFIAASLLGWA